MKKLLIVGLLVVVLFLVACARQADESAFAGQASGPQGVPKNVLVEKQKTTVYNSKKDIIKKSIDNSFIIVDIPDTTLKAKIIIALGDNNKEPKDQVTVGEAKMLTSLDAFGPYGANGNINNLKGLESFTNLQKIDLSRNQISDISSLKGMTQLTTLYLDYNKISDITPLKGMTQLTTLGLDVNDINDISSLKSMTQLTTLYLDYNQISDITPLKGMTKLITLNLGASQISDITPLKGMTQLISLGLDDNHISDISSLKDLTKLKTLYLGHNFQINDISPLKDMTQLTTLSLDYNQISDITPLKDMTQLTTLYINHNKISDISTLKGLTKLKTLVFDHNPISVNSFLNNMEKLHICTPDTNEFTISGRNYFVAGTTKKDSKSISDSCSIDGKTLSESYCRDNDIEGELITCSNGCKNDACVSEAPCKDEKENIKLGHSPSDSICAKRFLSTGLSKIEGYDYESCLAVYKGIPILSSGGAFSFGNFKYQLKSKYLAGTNSDWKGLCKEYIDTLTQNNNWVDYGDGNKLPLTLEEAKKCIDHIEFTIENDHLTNLYFPTC